MGYENAQKEILPQQRLEQVRKDRKRNTGLNQPSIYY